ncbi:MAG TPA: PIG-L family deacetylase [Opitutaceae bacterium]|nr:PIG-L family deacetylase [Opitutaceae bacterium]
MKPHAKSPFGSAPLLAFGAHPSDIEFGCGGIIARELQSGGSAHFVVCARSESGAHGTPAERTAEARASAAILGVTLEFVLVGGDSGAEAAAHAARLATVIRRVRPGAMFAPSLVENQHPDHPRIGRVVREAARLARGGPGRHSRAARPIGPLFFYAVSPEAEPAGVLPVLMDISDPKVVAAWNSAMEAHGSQRRSRDLAEYQLEGARVHGLRAGVELAQPLYPDEPLVFDSLAPLTRCARGP